MFVCCFNPMPRPLFLILLQATSQIILTTDPACLLLKRDKTSKLGFFLLAFSSLYYCFSVIAVTDSFKKLEI